jgi:hypothetical protein
VRDERQTRAAVRLSRVTCTFRHFRSALRELVAGGRSCFDYFRQSFTPRFVITIKRVREEEASLVVSYQLRGTFVRFDLLAHLLHRRSESLDLLLLLRDSCLLF